MSATRGATAPWSASNPNGLKRQRNAIPPTGPMETRRTGGEDWRKLAACRNEDPELFFVVGSTSGPALLQIEDAKNVCRRCPSVTPCLEFALESGQESGVWGMTSEDDRRAMKRRASRQRSRMGAAEAAE